MKIIIWKKNLFAWIILFCDEVVCGLVVRYVELITKQLSSVLVRSCVQNVDATMSVLL